MLAIDPPRSAAQAEADRLMTICNACRYCEGLCAMFPAMEMRRTFTNGDLNYLANLCHNCGACYFDCQYSPPHDFNVNIPRTLAQVRSESYAAYAWPRALAPLFARNGLAVTLIVSLSVAAFMIGFAAFREPAILFATHAGPGAFYAILPHNAMASIFGGAFLYAIVALSMGVRAFWTDQTPMPSAPGPRELWRAIRDAGSLRYLDGGGGGCMNADERPDDRRRLYHHMTFYGFMLCFASTSVATLYHYVWGLQAPYHWFSLPVILGTLGGIGLIVGPAGLMMAKWRREPDLADPSSRGMDAAFLVMLFLVSLTGLLLMVLRETPAMNVLLAIHLGVVFGLFITMPYGKFVHGIYRFVALVRYALERQHVPVSSQE
jgi:citrate/tricarballylate utilization protein